MKRYSGWILTILILMELLVLAYTSTAQQIADTSFNPSIENPAYPSGNGPIVFIDEAHFNFHTFSGRYQPLAALLRKDGYNVMASVSLFNKDSLHNADIMVISNALAERNRYDWSLPNPSAFSDDEISTLCDWVKDGGSLMLIADHMPFAGAAGKLAEGLGVRFSNGFAMNKMANEPTIFRRSEASLLDHPITNGRTAAERIDYIATFTGSAFQVRRAAQPLMIFGSSFISLMPKTAWKFGPGTFRISIQGWFQGAVFRYGRGRVAVFGEAAMFTAQLAGPNRKPVGMNSPIATQNSQFVLNVFHWLSGLLDSSAASEED